MTRTMMILLLLCAGAGIASGQKKIGSAGANVVIAQTSVKADSMWVADPPGNGNVTIIKPDAQGRFVLNFKPAFPRIIRIGIDKPKSWRIDLHLENGDQINIATDFNADTKFSGKGAMKQEIVFQDAQKRIQLYRNTDPKTVSANELLKQLNHISDYSIALLTANKQKVSPVFYKKQLIDFVYNKQNGAFGIPFQLKTWGKRKFSTAIPDGYWTFDKDIKIDDQLLSNKTYNDFITRRYVNFLRVRALMMQGKPDSLSVEERTKLEYELIERHLSGKTRSLALYKTFEIASYGAKDMQPYKSLLDKYLAQYATAGDARETLAIFEKFTRIKTGKEPPFFIFKDQDGKDVTLKDFAGKVVYMDFWASGCGPCRYEMKNGSPKLHAQFKDNKDVVFLYISIDDRADLWKKAIADDRIEGIHLLSPPGGFKSPVAEAFNIMGIPRYIIIGKDGKIFDEDAPRPSQDAATDRLNEALKANIPLSFRN